MALVNQHGSVPVPLSADAVMGRGDAGGGSASSASSAAADPAVARHLSIAIDRVSGGGSITDLSSPPSSSKRAGMLEATKSINALLEGGGRTADDLVDDTEWPSTILQDKDKCTAIIHLYRAEVGRLAAYRTRLDNTTNWCISMVGILSTFSISQSVVPHYFFGLIVILIVFFLLLESRRYILYDFVKHRARLMEIGFFNQALGPPPRVAWEQVLHRSYIVQVPRMTMTAALLLRLRRIYFVLFVVVYLAWITKVMLLMDAGDSFPYFWFCVLTLFMISGTGMLVVSLWRRSHALDEEDLDV